ncbi:MAG: DNA mismatch repair endonuclease MutL [Acidobacteria bacterium]|nr:DNA mismatch repair endonuclease MutL [Acidobacteriota bacterium]
MTRIRRLDPRTANQIAAGEVVERPASVVKELVENSLDAGAGSVRVELSKGGLGLIRVLDDGSGMGREDLVLALERHATSKIGVIEDLAKLSTLGFRGEALPSITSVSQTVLESAPDESGSGCRVEVEGGNVGKVEAVGHPRGTSVSVRNLFFNTPARRKFLRSEGTEMEQVLDTVSRASLAHFDRRFTLVADAKTLLDLPPAAQRVERVRQLFGDSVWQRLIPFSRMSGPARASGYTSRPDFTRSSAKDIRIFVNGRPVKDRGALGAVTRAYATLLPRGRYPFTLLFVDLPPERVDFNVHPTKWEVRFADPGGLFELVLGAIRTGIEQERPLASLQGFTLGSVSPAEENWSQGVPWRPAASVSASGSEKGSWEFSVGETSKGGDFQESRLPGMARMLPLAQYRESYILASDEGGLVIVDQHAAHERILYEQLLRQAEGSQVDRQSLLFPLTLELDPERSARLGAGQEKLDRLGFRLELFGERTWLIREVPALLGNADTGALLRDLADDLGAADSQGEVERVLDRLAATTACHAAVKVNFPLTTEKMSYLLDELGKTITPMTCPHGRPVVLRMAHRELEKNFHRR